MVIPIIYHKQYYYISCLLPRSRGSTIVEEKQDGERLGIMELEAGKVGPSGGGNKQGLHGY